MASVVFTHTDVKNLLTVHCLYVLVTMVAGVVFTRMAVKRVLRVPRLYAKPFEVFVTFEVFSDWLGLIGA